MSLLSLNKVCLVVDFDGYIFRGIFKPREIGYCSLTRPDRNGSFLFDLTDSFKTMTPKDWRTNVYVKENITGLTFKPLPWEKSKCLKEDRIDDVLDRLYRENKTRDEYVVGYKGGHYEKDSLKKLNIPSVDLTDFGCPKFAELAVVVVDSTIFSPTTKSCGLHFPLKRSNEIPHCPKMETFVFAEWLSKEQQQQM